LMDSRDRHRALVGRARSTAAKQPQRDETGECGLDVRKHDPKLRPEATDGQSVRTGIGF